MKKYCRKCCVKLVKDGEFVYFTSSGKKICAYNLICPNYKQPYDYYSCWNGINIKGHSDWTWDEDVNSIKEDKLGVIFPKDFPSFVKEIRCEGFIHRLSANHYEPSFA